MNAILEVLDGADEMGGRNTATLDLEEWMDPSEEELQTLEALLDHAAEQDRVETEIPWSESNDNERHAHGATPLVEQLPHGMETKLAVADVDANQRGFANFWDIGPEPPSRPEHLADLKVRESPSVDVDEIDKGLHESDLGRIAAELETLAAGLEPEEAGVELNLRGEFISAERGLFLNCRERGRVVAGYKAIYGPKRKWSEFCRIVKLARQTSYDLLASAEAEDMIESTESVQSSGKMRRPQVGYNFDKAVDKAVASLNRIFSGMTETQRQQALDATVDRLGAGTKIHLAA